MSDEERDATIAYLRQRMEMAELRVMEMEGRYDRLTVDYGEKVERLAAIKQILADLDPYEPNGSHGAIVKIYRLLATADSAPT